MRIQVALVLGALASASTAHALNQSKHHDITVASCTHAGLPSAFCERVGVEVYNVDAHEFNDLSAHSQIPEGSTACDAANASLSRVFWLGGQVRSALIAVGNSPSSTGVDTVAQHLGRALHTVQDNCAHSGMPNPQHAWHSLSDACRGTTESPDVSPAAFVCAANETDAIFSAFIDVLHDGGADFATLAAADGDDDEHWPAYADVCAFLGSAGQWTGEDRRWDMSVVRPALSDRLVRGLYGADSSQFAYVCTGSDDGVVPAYSDADRDTSGGAQSCVKIHAFCLDKADGVAADADPPPYETASDTSAAPAPATDASVHGGCSMSGGAPSSEAAAPLALLIVALLLLRRRDAI
ncbi:MAG TPA: MYXO-CTERM sorting domain-containing protein [Polyangia bacterium]|nr:MYXO-CTERM sorting domain-containing protein [Polyangia bacterium]